jgi:glycosyltransferase involved in cell wall biosynthesis
LSSVNLLLLNLGMDAAHPTLGHTTAWANELARRCAHVSVITMFAGELAVADNVTVHSLGKELGRSEPRRLVEFYRSVHHILGERSIDACFAHMAPLFAALFAPVAKLRRIPCLLWYAHTSVTPTLRVAHALADRCLTPTAGSFLLPSDKVFVVGHGIDTQTFRPPEDTRPSYETTALHVGRITPIKRIDEMLEALAILKSTFGRSFRLKLVGGPSTATDRQYERSLRETARSREIERLVTFHGPVPFYSVLPHYHAGALFLNLSTGALDKATLESMAAGCIPISRNPAFEELARAHGLGWLVPPPGPRGLAETMVKVLERSREERPALATRLRGIVVDEHSLSRLSDRIMDHLAALARSRR